MGQRFQSVFILPEIYINEGNCNNKNKRVLVYHNQWLYGFSAIRDNLEVMKRIKEAYNNNKKSKLFNTKKDFINFHLEQFLELNLDYVILKPNELRSRFHKSYEFDFKDFKHLGIELSKEDNNNGFFICEITEDLNFKYSFISGLEDENIVKPKDPKEYFNLFYKEKDLSKKDIKELNKIINNYLKFEGLLLKDVLEITKEINNNKPKWAITE